MSLSQAERTNRLAQINRLPVGGERQFECWCSHLGWSLIGAFDTREEAEAAVNGWRGLAGRSSASPPLARKCQWQIRDRNTKAILKSYDADSGRKD